MKSTITKILEGRSAHLLETLAERYLSVPTLATNKNDERNYYRLSVWAIKEAMFAAYKAGYHEGRGL